VCLEAEDGMEVDGKYWGQREGRDAMKKFWEVGAGGCLL
jgi:hypothetical protein